VSLVVIGGGQAGLAVSHELQVLGIEHVVLERDRVAETWRGRWDSFRLVTPNWTLDLPGAPYAGDDPDGFVRAMRSSTIWSSTQPTCRCAPASRLRAWSPARPVASCFALPAASSPPTRWSVGRGCYTPAALACTSPSTCGPATLRPTSWT
jgi:hypothetical protein